MNPVHTLTPATFRNMLKEMLIPRQTFFPDGGPPLNYCTYLDHKYKRLELLRAMLASNAVTENVWCIPSHSPKILTAGFIWITLLYRFFFTLYSNKILRMSSHVGVNLGLACKVRTETKSDNKEMRRISEETK
jgi:hypothetical protein